MNGAKLLDEALKGVESDSIKEWANTSHNRPIFEKIAQNALDKNKDADPIRFGAYIVCLAMGA
jgi:hypothetical protein